MQDLKELILLLKQHNIHPLKHLLTPADSKSKLLALYEGISKGKFNSDDEASEQLYSEKGESSKYRKLKSDLREKLLDTIFYINTDQGGYSDYQKAYYDCHKMWVIIRILTGQNANTAALILANKLLRQAEKFDFTLLSMDIASYLRIQYGLRESNDRKFKEANQLFEHYRKVYDAECLAEELYTTLIVRYVNNRSAQEEVHRLAGEYYEKIEPALGQFHTYKLHMYGYMIGLMRYTTVNDHVKALEYTEMAIRFFSDRPYEARVPLQIFYYQRLICNIQLRQFEDGKESARFCMKMMQEGTFNWFKYNELYLHLSLHTAQYNQASETLFTTLNHPRFEFLPENAKELWRIYESYVYYIATLGKMSSPGKHKFKLAKFINETPIFSKDKSGMNIAILVIKLLFLLQERRYGKLLDEVEAVEQYCYRHLRGGNTQRSYYFLKLLMQIPLGHFDASVIKPKAEKYLEKLNAIPIQVANQTHEIEVVPYEDLWNLAMEWLSAQN